MPAFIFDFKKASACVERQMFLSCPECGSDHTAATAWAVKGVAGQNCPVITALVCPSCEYQYQVRLGEVREAANNQLRARPYKHFPIALLICYVVVIGGLIILWKLL